MMQAQHFTYTQQQVSGVNTGLPFVPITLRYKTQILTVSALVDSGSTVNVLPYDMGRQLGLTWETQDFPLKVVGVLRGAPAYGVVLTGEINPFPSMKLAFVWTRKTSAEIRPILGQINFFQVFKVVFDGQAQIFELIRNY